MILVKKLSGVEMKTYIVSFFGHRDFDRHIKHEDKVKLIIKRLLEEKEIVEFIVGRNGEFDKFAASMVRTVRKETGRDNSFLTCVLPYATAEYQNNIEEYESYYDYVEVCESAERAHFEKSIEIRNKEMVERADLIICYVTKNTGGAYRALKYATDLEKKIVNLIETQ